MSSSWKLVLLCLAIAAGWPATNASAQIPSYGRPNAGAEQPQPVKPRSYTDTKAIVSEVKADSISVVADKKLWVLYPQPNCVVELTGQAELSYLKPGMVVRLYGQFDKRYKPLAPINSLEIVSPQSPNVALGIFPDTLPPSEEKAKAKQAAEEKAKTPEKDAAKVEPEAKAADDTPKPTMIVGKLNVVKDGELFVSTGSRTIGAQLAEDADIRVSLTDFTLAKKGDAMKKFSCDYIQPGLGSAKLLIIELTDPLEGPKKPVRKTAAKPSAKSSSKGAEKK